MRVGSRLRGPGKAIALVAAGALGAGGAFAVASVPDGGGAIHACVGVLTANGQTVPNTRSANVTIIDPGAGQTCTAGQQALAWNVTGPQGPAGPRGVSGLQGPQGLPGATGAPGRGKVVQLTLRTPLVKSTGKPLAEARLGTGSGALTFPLLAYATSPAAKGTGSRRVKLSEIVITKKLDKASAKLFQYAATGKHFQSATITLRKQGSNPVTYLVIKLKDVLIGSVQSQGGGGGKNPTPTETLSLSFGTVKYQYK